MNIAYLLYREDIFSPLVESQVLNNLYKIKNDDVTIHFIWLKRLDYCFKFSDKIDYVRHNLKAHGIILHEIPILVGRFPLDKQMSRFVYVQTSKKIRSIIKKNRIELLHTRGYNAGLIATILLKKESGISHVFDPRSPYLTEIVSTYGVKENDSKYEFWRQSEEYIIKNATITVAISETFADYLTKRGGKVVVIPNNSEMDDVNTVTDRTIKQRRMSFCFVGSLGYGWNNVLEYISFMKKVWEINPSVKLELYLLNQDVARRELQNAHIAEANYIIKTLPQSEVGKTISGCLAGLQIMSKPDSRLGIKTVDYLSAGVPVICNNHAMGASQIVEKYEVGWNIDIVNLADIINSAFELKISGEKCAKIAWDNFSTETVARKYLKLYKELTK